jgi:hypothetical protein
MWFLVTALLDEYPVRVYSLSVGSDTSRHPHIICNVRVLPPVIGQQAVALIISTSSMRETGYLDQESGEGERHRHRHTTGLTTDGHEMTEIPKSAANQKHKGKTIPVQAWTGPEGYKRLRLPDFKKVVRLSALGTGHLYTQKKYLWY